MQKKRVIPGFLVGVVAPEAYEKWISRKAQAHMKRDRKRGLPCTGASYRDAIHEAVLRSAGVDAYTGETLHWHLISTYNNEDSEAGRHSYKASFALLPTVDHVSASSGREGFNICAWRTNDSKNDLSIEDFRELCKRVLNAAGYDVVLRS